MQQRIAFLFCLLFALKASAIHQNIYEEKTDANGRHILFHIYAGDQQVCTCEAGSALAQSGGDSGKIGYYYHEDSLNSSSALSDSSGNQKEVDVYYPFGRTVTGTLQASFQVSRKFTGQVYDQETGLYYYNARYYDPELGRFIQPDTEIPDLSNPQSYNRYSYCVNDPLRYTDPTGHGAWGDALWNEGTFTSSYQLITMHDSFGWKMVEVPVGVLGVGVATIDTGLNFASGGTKAAAEGTVKGLVKGVTEGLGKTEGEKVLKTGAEDAEKKAASWKAGDDPRAQTRAGNAPSDSTVRRREWKNEAQSPARSDYTPEDVQRMQEGKPPQRYNPDKGGTESMERSHEPIPKREGGTQTVPRWPQEHAAVDPQRRPGY